MRNWIKNGLVGLALLGVGGTASAESINSIPKGTIEIYNSSPDVEESERGYAIFGLSDEYHTGFQRGEDSEKSGKRLEAYLISQAKKLDGYFRPLLDPGEDLPATFYFHLKNNIKPSKLKEHFLDLVVTNEGLFDGLEISVYNSNRPNEVYTLVKDGSTRIDLSGLDYRPGEEDTFVMNIFAKEVPEPSQLAGLAALFASLGCYGLRKR